MLQHWRGKIERLSETQQRVALAAIALVLALVLRTVGLNSLTPGLRVAEATQGLFARQITDEAYPILFGGETEAGEPLFPYLLKGMTLVAGEGVLQARLVAAILGSLIVLCCAMWLYRALGGWWWGLGGAVLSAAGFWQLMYSRQALPDIAVALAASAGLWFLWEAIHSAVEHGNRYSMWYPCAGFAFGVGIYTHVSGLILPVVVLVSLLPLGWATQHRAAHFEGRGFGILIGVMLLTMAPLASFYIENPSILQRDLDLAGGLPEQLTEGRAETAVLIERIIWNGSTNQAVNLPGRPVLDPILVIWGAAGLLVALVRPVRSLHAVLLVWLLLPIVPVALLDPNETALLLPMTPIFVALPLLGMHAGLDAVRRWRPRFKPILAGVAVLSVIASGAWSVSAYFVQWADDPDTYLALRGDVRDALSASDNLPDDGNPLYFMAGDAGRIVRYLEPERTYRLIETSNVVPIPRRSDAYLVAPASNAPHDALVASLDDPVEYESAPGGGDAYRIWFLDARTRDELPRSLPTVTFANSWRLDGYSERAVELPDGAEGGLEVVTVWRVPLDADPHKVEVQLDPIDGGRATSARQLAHPWKNNPLEEGEILLVVIEVLLPTREEITVDLKVALNDLGNSPVRPVHPTLMIDERTYALLNRLSLVGES